MYEELRYRRQFMLVREAIPALHDWRCEQIGAFRLHTHPDLELHVASNGPITMALLGSIFDPARPELDNASLLAEIVATSKNIDSCSAGFKPLCGIYAFVYAGADGIFVQHDALSLREVYFCTGPNVVVCASQPNFIAAHSRPSIVPSRDPRLIDFRARHFKHAKWIGSETAFEGIHHLLPNHRLDVQRSAAVRYWPDQPIPRVSLHDAVQRSTCFLQGAMRAITNRHSVMMAVTAGTDSRTLLAASREVSDRIYYFINDQGLSDKHPDVAVPREMFDGIGKEFHIHRVESEVDDAFRRVFLENVFHASDRILPTIQNVYFKRHADKVNILGIGEIGRTRYGKQPATLDAFRVAYKLGYPDSDYVLEKSVAICQDLVDTSRRFQVNALTLLYWEQMMGNWGTVGNSESDIAIEEIDPYDSHALYETFLGVDPQYCRYKESPCVFFREMIHTMWPRLLDWPINPPFTVRNRRDQLLGTMGLFAPLKELKYRMKQLVAQASRAR